MILVTGSTGNIGSELVKKLSETKQPFRTFVRTRSKAQRLALQGIGVVEGDFAKPETFRRALSGVDRLFLLIPSSPHSESQQRDFVEAAVRSKVKHIVKVSQLGADTHARCRFQRVHGAVENYILSSDVAYTFLRPNLFMQGLLNFRPTILSEGAFYAPAGNAKVSVVDTRDIASIAAKALTESGHEGKTYNITGPQPLTHTQMADDLTEATGRPIKYVDVKPEVMKEALLRVDMPEWQADGVIEDYERYRLGEAAMVTSTVKEVTGVEATKFMQFAKDYAREFSAKAQPVHDAGRDHRRGDGTAGLSGTTFDTTRGEGNEAP
jgi:uncharacterized protein YbjT (DUF2867 family)